LSRSPDDAAGFEKELGENRVPSPVATLGSPCFDQEDRKVSSAQLQVTGEAYRNAAVLLWGDAGAYARDAFARINHDLFVNELPSLPIVIGTTAYGHCLGLTRHRDRELPRISLAVGMFNKQIPGELTQKQIAAGHNQYVPPHSTVA
jgi:hypothetical protein